MDTTEGDLGTITRRVFLKGLGATAVVGAIKEVKSSYNKRSENIGSERDWRERSTSSLRSEGQTELQVRHFAGDIYDASQRLCGELDRRIWAYSAFFGGFVLGNYHSELKEGSSSLITEEVNRPSAYTSALVTTMAGIPRVLVAETMENKKFSEYGLDVYFFEENEFFNTHSSSGTALLRTVATALTVGALASRIPSWGFGMTGYLGAEGVRKLRRNEGIQVAYSLGEQVEKQIEQGKDHRHIENYLSTVTSSNLSAATQPTRF